MLYAEGYLYIIQPMLTRQRARCKKDECRRDNLTRGDWGQGEGQGRGRTWTQSKNHTFFIFGWCAAEMRRIIDVSCLPGAGS